MGNGGDDAGRTPPDRQAGAAGPREGGPEASGPVDASGSGAGDRWRDRIEARFAKMNRLLDGEDVSSVNAASLSAAGLSNSLLAQAAPRRAVAEEALALLAHRAGVPVGDCETAEAAATRVRVALERPLREEISGLRRALERQAEQASGPSFRERLVIEAGEALARAVALGDQAALAAAVAKVVERVRLLHAED